MLNSMTGFGRATATLDGKEITVEIKCVNHRYFECSTRLPRSFSYLEERVKAQVQTLLSRGKIEVGVQISDTAERPVVIEPNMAVARGYLEALRKIGEELSLPCDLSAPSLARFPDLFTVTAEEIDEDALWGDVSSVLGEALTSCLDMRRREGERLAADISGRLDSIEQAVGFIESTSAGRMERYRERLFQRMKATLEGAGIEENRILLEAAIFADKTAVDEETVRLRSHIKQARAILKASEPIGRKFDFLIQEFNREINTIGSKCNELEITERVVEVKADIEKIREQVQNIE